jgi:hypothetical protein
MSGFSFSDLANLGAVANESINAVVSPMYYGDVRRVFAGTILVEDGPSHGDFILGPGEHQGLVMEKALGSLRGEPGAIVTELATFKSMTKVDGVLFKQGEKNTSHLVLVDSAAKVVFSNCIFQREAGADSGSGNLCFVLINAGGKAVFNACSFRSSAESGAMISVAGTAIQDLNAVAGSVFVGLGSNYSGHPHSATVTPVGGEIS